MKDLLVLILGVFFVYLFVRFFLSNKSKSHALDPDKDERVKNDAKRFAKLLAAEIKLYNEYKIQRIANGENFREVLRDEIENARKNFHKRGYGREIEKNFDETLLENFEPNNEQILKLENSP